MPYRPLPQHRQSPSISRHLTAALFQIYGHRSEDGARPLGAFYTKNLDSDIWMHLGGIWYRPVDEAVVTARNTDSETVEAFIQSVLTGETIRLRTNESIEWEELPLTDAIQLPPPLNI